jgi:hypothetical protein
LGYYSGLQNFYCKYKYNKYIHYDNIIYQSILEGLVFIYLGYILKNLITSKYIICFIIGFILHILSELLGFHYLFCNINIK